MTGLDAAIRNSGVTPARKLHVTYDIDDVAVTEPAFSRHVEREQIRAQAVSGCRRLLSGAWHLNPLNEDWAQAHETTAGQQYIVRLGEFTADALLVEIPLQRKLSELTGIGADAGVATSGDYYITKRVPAGTSWASSFSSSQPKITYSSENYA